MEPSKPPGSFTIRSRRVVTLDGERPATVRVKDGVVASVEAFEEEAVDIDLGYLALLPGVVDSHVHCNEPGRTDWEGFAHATRGAAAGGVTTLVDMPLNSIPAVTDETGLETKRLAAAGSCWVDVGFWGGVVPGNVEELEPLHRAGALGFKCFLAPSGVEEFPAVGPEDLRRAAPVLAELGALLLVHAELASVLEEPVRRLEAAPSVERRRYAAYLASRPDKAELEAIKLLLDLSREHGTRIHVVHLSTAAALPLLRRAKEEGLPVTVETCPHYLAFAAEEIPGGATQYKCAPPIRDRENRERLWEALLAGDIDLVASDHSPCPPELKARDVGDFAAAWGGIASLQVALPALWNEAAGRGATLADLARWTSAGPAHLCGLELRKGAIAQGRDADLVVFDPEREWRLKTDTWLHRHAVSPWIGRVFQGRVERTFLRGVEIYDGQQVGPHPRGRILSR